VIYLDNNATTRPDDQVIEVMNHYLREDFGNAGSISHRLGSSAKQAVEQARSRIADYLGVMTTDIIFTSGATEANNIATLGLSQWLAEQQKSVVTSTVEHKAIIEPIQQMEIRGIEAYFLKPAQGAFARFTAEDVAERLPKNVGLVSLMWANNETGCVSDIEEIAAAIKQEYPECLVHSDCTQGFGKLEPLNLENIDMLSASGHKMYGPKGIGFLYINRHARKRCKPLLFGGGQERGLSPGTQPVFLIAGLGKAVELCKKEFIARQNHLDKIRYVMTEVMDSAEGILNSSDNRLPNTMNLYLPHRDAEATMIKLKDYFAVSSGSACTSATFEPSHVLKTIFPKEAARWSQSLRFSWSHQTQAFQASSLSTLLR
jgi:cysteine desulfurase